MKQVIAVSLITLLCACGVMKSPENEASSIYNKWVGRTVDELLTEYGEPDDIYRLEGGIRMFVYPKLRKITTDTQSSKSAASLPTARPGEEIPIQPIFSVDQNVPQEMPAMGTRPQIWRSRTGHKKTAPVQECKILFKASASDIIDGWSIEGENCN